METTKIRFVLVPIMVGIDKDEVIEMRMPTTEQTERALKQQAFYTDKTAWDYLKGLVE